ncbi:hypothetical protein J6T21_02060 [Candidatus Saccharibacteria bacterium]|nr:hypothetical protein [Candidatus Saccharibacteria bacterium]
MSLLHGVKKRLTILLVFTIILSSLSSVFLNTEAFAVSYDSEVNPTAALNNAFAKSIVGYIAHCININANGDYDVNSYKSDGTIDDAERLDIKPEETVTDYSTSVPYYLGAKLLNPNVDSKKANSYQCNDSEINFFNVITKLNEYTGINYDYHNYYEDEHEFLYENVYKHQKTEISKADVLACLRKDNGYIAANCYVNDSSDNVIDIDQGTTNEMSKFLKFIHKTYNNNGRNLFAGLTQNEKGALYYYFRDISFLPYTTKNYPEIQLIKISKTEYDNMASKANCRYRLLNKEKTDWEYYKIHDPTDTNGGCRRQKVGWTVSTYHSDDNEVYTNVYQIHDSSSYNIAEIYAQSIINYNNELIQQSLQDSLDNNKKKCENEYSDWKTQYLSAWYMADPAPPQEWKDKAQQKYKEAISEVEEAHPLTDLYLLNDNSRLVKEGTNDAPNVLWFGPNKIKIDRSKTDDPNRCLKKYYEEAIDEKFREWVNEEAAAATEKQKEAITKKLSDACAKNFKSWLNALYANNGANSTLYTPGSPSTIYTEESQAQRDKINAAVSKAFGYGNNTVDKWLDRIFIEPNTHTAIIRDWEHGGTPGTGNTHNGGTYGNCQACLFIEMASESLRKNAPDIRVPAYEEGGCTNPQPSDFNDDSGTWIPPSVVVPIEDYDPVDYEPIVIDDIYDYTNTSYEGTTYEPDTCYDGSGTLGWILCPLIAGASNIGEGLWNQIETYHLKLPANALFGSIGSTNESGIHFAWRSIRDIANIVFVIVFLIIVISQVTGAGISNYGIKKMLPKLIVCIVVVNLSYILCQIAVDLSNTIGSSITDFLRGIAGKIPWKIANVSNTGDGGLFSNGFITGVLIAGAAGGLFALISSMRTENGVGAIIGGLGLFVLGIVIVILVAIITLYITLMIREAAVVVCIAIAPLAIACNVLPNTQPLFKKWLSLMKALLVLYPVSAFMVGGGQLAGAILASTGLNTMRLAAGVVQVLPYFFVPTLLRKSLAGLGNIGAKIGSLGKGLGRKASHGATGLVKNKRRYQDMLAGSKAKAENRYNRGEEARLRRKQERRRRHGRELSDQDTLRLEAATDKNFARDTKIEEARVSSEADRVAARRRAASSDIAVKDAQLMNGGFGDAANADAFAQAKLNQAITEAKRSTAETAIKYGGAKLNTDGSLTYNESRAAQANRGYIVQGAIQAENSMKDAAAIAKNEAMYTRAKILEGEVARKDQMDKLAATYGGAKYDDNGQLLKDSDGNYITSAARARDYARGERLNTAIQTRKEAEEKIAEAKHAQSLFRAAAIKGDIDLENKMRTARAFSEDMDADGNFVPKGTGVYSSNAYAQNYRTTETNKTNSTLASGHTASTPNPFSDAKTTYQQKANNELFQSYETSFANTSTNDLLKMRTEMMSSFNPANTGSIQKAAALANALFKSKNEDLAQDLLANVTSKVDLPQLQELMRSVDPGEVSGVKGYKTAVLNASEAVAYNDYVNGTIKLQTNPTTGKDEPVMLSMAAQAAKKDGGVTSMDPDTIKYVESQVKNLPSSTNQTVISGAQVLHNILNSNKESAQTSMATILAKTESAEFDNLGISGNDILNIKFDKVGQEKLKNLASIADMNTNFEDSMKKIVASITEEKKSSMDPNTYAALVSKYGGGGAPNPQPQHPNTDGGRYYHPTGEQKK